MEEELRMEKMVQSDAEIAEKFAQIVADSLRIDPSRVTLDAYLDDLGAESLDLIEITMESEAAFNVWIPEKSILETATEVFGPGVLEQDGYLTDEGRRLMMHRVPQAEANALSQRLSVQDLRRYFVQVGTWVRMVSELMKHTPEVCTSCGGSLKAAPGLRLKCAACGEEVRLRSGEELNREWVLNYYSGLLLSERPAGAGLQSKSACMSS
jgi:acyl carrier protein